MATSETGAKKRVFSAIQPSGTLTLGNYLGALKNWAAMQDEYECIYAVADLHAITVRQEPAQFRRQILDTCALLLAIGIDPEKSILFLQSQVPEHAQLTWLLACCTQFGELARMTQFKEKSARNRDNVNAGLFTYPSLMAADILLYQSDAVPVGEDQRQHIELTRTVAERFNFLYPGVFKVPKAIIPQNAARVRSLQDPSKKMSKSDENAGAWVSLLDTKDDIIRKFKRAVTDSGAQVRCAEGKDGICNLISIYGAATGKSSGEIEREFDGRGYGEFKLAVGEAVAGMLRPIREKYDELIGDKEQLLALYALGAEKAQYIARKTLAKAMKKVGFLEKASVKTKSFF